MSETSVRVPKTGVVEDGCKGVESGCGRRCMTTKDTCSGFGNGCGGSKRLGWVDDVAARCKVVVAKIK